MDLGQEHPRKRMILILVAVIAGLIGLVWTRSIPLSILGIVLILTSSGELLLPTHYKLDESGATSKCGANNTVLEWDRVVSAWVDEEGVKLSPLPKGARMEPFRGVYLRFANNQDAVLAKIAHHWNGDAVFLGRGNDPGSGGRPDTEVCRRDREEGDGSADNSGA